jgi:hypothetical protein
MAKRTRRARKAASHLPPKLQDIAFTKNKRPRAAHPRRQSRGAASPVRHIDPKDYLASG